jgi:hypothetical protein
LLSRISESEKRQDAKNAKEKKIEDGILNGEDQESESLFRLRNYIFSLGGLGVLAFLLGPA